MKKAEKITMATLGTVLTGGVAWLIKEACQSQAQNRKNAAHRVKIQNLFK